MDPVEGGLLKNWATWDYEIMTLTVSKPPELSHDQLQAIWSPYINRGVTQANLYEINRQIDCEVRRIRLLAEEQTREQRRRQEEEERQRQAEATRREQERIQNEREAKERAEVLLLRHLSDKQKEDLKTKNYFLVEVEGETYKITRGFAGNVKLLDKAGRDAKSFCIHPRERVPDADSMLAQKLLLETDKEKFLKIANATELHPANDTRRAA